MKKFFAALLALISMLTASAFAEDKLSIVCTTFPQYDWVRQILGTHVDDVELTLLLDNGIDLHNYQPTAADIAKISSSDLFIYVGGESDGWVADVLDAAQNPNLKAISMLASVEAKEEEVVEGMQETEDEEESEDEPEYDEHVWLSLRNAKTICETITDALCAFDPANAVDYSANDVIYAEQLSALDVKYQEITNNSARRTILFADRFPFRYLADDYSLTYYAAFVGCSAETEASFETIAFLAQKVDELELPVVLTIEGDNHAIAETVVANTQTKDQKIMVMNSIQSVTMSDIQDGRTYLGIMTDNLDVLKAALQ